MGTPEERLADLGLALPGPIPAHGKHRPVVIDRGVAYLSAAVATEGDPPVLAWPGRLGAEVTLDEGRASARGALLVLLANLRSVVGSLDAVERFLRLNGYVAVTPGFDKAHHVVGAASDLLADVFGDEQVPSRSVAGVCELPGRASVALDAIIRLKDV
jgi:enamine deaminase RidA (YjgF/YER057c/UK114 family)